MPSILQINYKGRLYPDFSFIEIGEVDVDKHPEIKYNMELINNTKLTTRNMKIESGMPAELWSASIPDIMEMESKAPMSITLKVAKIIESKDPTLFDPAEQKHQILFEITYEKVRTFT